MSDPASTPHAPGAPEGAPVPHVPHPAPFDTPCQPPNMAFERARDLPRLERIAEDLAAVEAALARLDDGSYGHCVHCGEPIADSRLAHSPAATECGRHGSEFFSGYAAK